MKKVLLTESEYRKVCKVLNEGIYDKFYTPEEMAEMGFHYYVSVRYNINVSSRIGRLANRYGARKSGSISMFNSYDRDIYFSTKEAAESFKTDALTFNDDPMCRVKVSEVYTTP